MRVRRPSRRLLPAFAASCLIGVSLLATPAHAQKTKNKDTGLAAEAPASTAATSIRVEVPTIETVGSSMSDEAILDILRGNIAGNAEELSTLSADSIVVPEITVTVETAMDGETLTSVVSFAGLSLQGVSDGVASSVSLEGTTMTADEFEASYGTISAENVDIGRLLGIYGLVATDGQDDLATVYTNFVAAGGTLDAEDVSCTIGEVTNAQLEARPLKTSFADMFALVQAMEANPDNPDPKLVGDAMRLYADIFTAFRSTDMSFGGIDCSGVDDEGRPVAVSVGGVTMSGFEPGYYPSISVDGLRVDMEEEGSVLVDNFTYKRMDLSGPLAAVAAAPEAIDQAWLDVNFRSLIPAMEGASFSGLSVDIPDPEAADSRIQFGVGSFDLSLENYINGIPASIDTSATGVVAQLPEDTADPQLQQLVALGVTSLDAAFRFAVHWNEESEQIEVDEVSISGVDLASVVIEGIIGNAPADLFGLDDTAAMEAAMALALQSLDLSVTDEGLSDIILAVVGAEQGTDPEAMRPIFAGLAEGTVIGMMAGAADAAKLGSAINSFVSGTAKTLNIGIKAKDPAGLGLADFMMAEEDPASLLTKVDVSATAK